LGLAEGGLGGKPVSGGAAGAENFFDGAAECEANAIQVARYAGLVFGELAADFGEGLLFGVVEPKALFVARIEGGESGLQGADKKSGVALAVGVGRLDGNRVRDFLDSLGVGRSSVIFIEGFEAAIGADTIDVTLSENGAEPGFERAAAVEIAEEGAVAAVSIGEAIEFGEERVSELAGFGRSGATTEDGSCGGAKVRSIGGHKMLPSGLAIFHASGGEGQVLEMERGEIFVEFFGCKISGG
jgi:hypothetical protein